MSPPQRTFLTPQGIPDGDGSSAANRFSPASASLSRGRLWGETLASTPHHRKVERLAGKAVSDTRRSRTTVIGDGKGATNQALPEVNATFPKVEVQVAVEVGHGSKGGSGGVRSTAPRSSFSGGAASTARGCRHREEGGDGRKRATPAGHGLAWRYVAGGTWPVGGAWRRRPARRAKSATPVVGLPGKGLGMEKHGWWREASEEHERAQHGGTWLVSTARRFERCGSEPAVV
uniref:Uncharacterized protein n=1 Tax=Oryza glumipatula TaxID=40148 RepID=A0A0E0B9X9_9ORYZ